MIALQIVFCSLGIGIAIYLIVTGIRDIYEKVKSNKGGDEE